MPLFDFKCAECGNVEEHVVFSGELGRFLCSKCGYMMTKEIPKGVSFNTSLETGVWERGPDGQDHYKGKGGRKVPVHKDGTPIES